MVCACSGAFWIEASRGTDITEAFETAHVNPKVASMLPAYCVGDASGRRNSPFTFNKDDFYCTLKRKVIEYNLAFLVI